jgi:hypothetical protein
MLGAYLEAKVVPPPCTAKERWGDRKCQQYCDVAGNCSYAQELKESKEKAA